MSIKCALTICSFYIVTHFIISPWLSAWVTISGVYFFCCWWSTNCCLTLMNPTERTALLSACLHSCWAQGSSVCSHVAEPRVYTGVLCICWTLQSLIGFIHDSSAQQPTEHDRIDLVIQRKLWKMCILAEMNHIYWRNLQYQCPKHGGKQSCDSILKK